MDTPTIDFMNERSANSFLAVTEDGDMCFRGMIDENQWLIFDYRRDNYPAVTTGTVNSTVEDMRKGVELHYPSDVWIVRKNNLQANLKTSEQLEDDSL